MSAKRPVSPANYRAPQPVVLLLEPQIGLPAHAGCFGGNSLLPLVVPFHISGSRFAILSAR
jgi:hypothetical protein